jgi:glycosyltransferase involved in cell wall biosynthesis
MASAVPLVATDTGGIAEVVFSGKTGYLVKPHDIISLQNQVEELLRNDQKRDAFGKLSRVLMSAKEFLLSSMVKSTQELYLNLVRRCENA